MNETTEVIFSFRHVNLQISGESESLQFVETTILYSEGT